MRLAVIACGLCVFLAAGQALAGPLPACAGSAEPAGVRIASVEDNGTLVLADGRVLDLEGVLLPDGRYRAQALSALRDLAGGRKIVAAAKSPMRDRYGRIEAQIFLPDNADDGWLQTVILKRGLARVFVTPDRPECASELLAAEQGARAAGEGIWTSPAYAVRTPDALSRRDTGTFQIVEGKVVSAAVKSGRAYLDFGADWKTDFTATIAPETMKLFRAAGIDPRDYASQTIRVRGWIEQYHGPELEVAAPQDVEIVK